VNRALMFGVAFGVLAAADWYRVYRHGPSPFWLVAAVFCTVVALLWIWVWFRGRRAE
jgi:hypothetical protein